MKTTKTFTLSLVLIGLLAVFAFAEMPPYELLEVVYYGELPEHQQARFTDRNFIYDISVANGYTTVVVNATDLGNKPNAAARLDKELAALMNIYAHREVVRDFNDLTVGTYMVDPAGVGYECFVTTVQGGLKVPVCTEIVRQ